MAHAPNVRLIWAAPASAARRWSASRAAGEIPRADGRTLLPPGLTDSTGGLRRSEWKALLTAHSERFLIGSDTWINARWAGYEAS